MVFLMRKVFKVENFTIEPPAHGHSHRRPPVVLSREEVRSILAYLADPWKLAAQLMYGSGLRLMETLRLRVMNVDFGQGNIVVNNGKGAKHRVVPLPRARNVNAAPISRRDPKGPAFEESDMPYIAALLRDPSTGKRCGHQNGSKPARSFRCVHDNDLSSRHPTSQRRRPQSDGSSVIIFNSVL